MDKNRPILIIHDSPAKAREWQRYVQYQSREMVVVAGSFAEAHALLHIGRVPWLVVMNDLDDSGPGWVVRLRQSPRGHEVPVFVFLGNKARYEAYLAAGVTVFGTMRLHRVEVLQTVIRERRALQRQQRDGQGPINTRVLFVSSDAQRRATLKAWLEWRALCSVDTACNFDEAEAYLADYSPPAVMVLDDFDEDGPLWVQRIHDAPKTRSLPIFVLTPQQHMGRRYWEYKENGVLGYLHKLVPVNKGNLRNSIERYLA